MKIVQVNDQVHVVTGTNVNWALVTDPDGVTIVDAGYRNDHDALLASIDHIGRRPEDVRAIVLTHAHLDHLGGIPALRALHPVPVLTSEQEARHARREHLEQITPAQMLRQCTTRAGRRWVAQTLRAVLPEASMELQDVSIATPGEPLDLPGELVTVATPGHTSGHTAWLMPSTGVVFTGDALVTGHPISCQGSGPQLLPTVFNEDEAVMARSLEVIGALPADTIVPGHGEHVRGDLAAITAAVSARANR